MKEKPGIPKLKVLLALVAAVIFGSLVALMRADVPAPSKPVEKQLDAKAFLEQK